jgi:glycerophosphoryl diester phosphodiesterase
MWVNVEIKADIVDESGWVGQDRIRAFVESVVNIIDAGGDTERVLYSSFAIEVIDRCREMGPDGVRTAFLCKDVTADSIGYCVDRGHDAIHPFVGGLTREDVDRCHQLGLQVNTWTCNDAPTMDALIEWGVDGICTDVPDLLIARLAAARPPKRTD